MHYLIYAGKADASESVGITQRTLISLCKDVTSPGSLITGDNYFTTVQLAEDLAALGLFYMGTIRTNRLGMGPKNVFSDRKKWEKKNVERGTIQWRYKYVNNHCISACFWKDNRVVYLVSSAHRPGDTTTVKRRDGANEFMIDCPTVVKDYNRLMGGTDRQDQYITMYNRHSKANRWWQNVFWWVINSCIHNAYIAWNMAKPKKDQYSSFLSFKRQLMVELLAGWEGRKLVPSTGKKRRIENSVEVNTASSHKHPNSAHAGPVKLFKGSPSKRRRCVVCKNKTNWGCGGCEQFMCNTQCFTTHHSH